MSPLREIKREIRILGIDDAPFTRLSAKTLLLGVVFRGASTVDGAMASQIDVDGDDATDKIADMISKSPHRKQLRVIMLHGITFGGFNIVRIRLLNGLVGLPIVVVTERRPRADRVERAIRHLSGYEKKLEAIREGGEVLPVETKLGAPVYVQLAGIDYAHASKIVKSAARNSRMPEPLRVANIIASALKARL